MEDGACWKPLEGREYPQFMRHRYIGEVQYCAMPACGKGTSLFLSAADSASSTLDRRPSKVSAGSAMHTPAFLPQLLLPT